jgi:SpoIIAA-like
MIKIIDGLPANTVGFEAVGHVEADDYRSTLDPAITTALEGNDKIRLLYVLGSDFDGYSGGAMWEDAKVGMSNWTKWERIAVVTDHGGVKDGIKFFGWMVPGELKTFSVDELADAKAWLAE